MIIQLSTVHEGAQVIPLLFKEGIGVVDRVSASGAHHLLPSPPAEEAKHFQNRKETRKRPAKGGRERENAKKDVKI
jgi:hypothetical protein